MSDLETIKEILLRAGYVERPGESGGADGARIRHRHPLLLVLLRDLPCLDTPLPDHVLGETLCYPDLPEQDPPEPGDGLNVCEFAHHVPAAAGHQYPQSIELGQGQHGYAGFAVSLFFDEEGRFVGHASWE